MLSDEQKNILTQLYAERGLKGFKKNQILVGSSKFSDAQRALKAMGFPDCMEPHADKLWRVISKYSDHKMALANHLSETARSLVKESFRTIEDEEGITSNRNLFDYIVNLVPVVDITGRVKGKDRILLLDPESMRPVPDVDVEIYMLRTGVNEQELFVSSDILSVTPIFNPYSLEPIIMKTHESSGLEISHINTYVPPKWRFLEAAPRYGGFIKTLIEWLFPVEWEREAVLDWAHHAITHRNGTTLCLAGPRGTGKSLFSTIMGYLIGDKYHEYVNKEILEEKFNSAFKNKRLVIFEEVELDTSVAINRLKAFSNNRIVLEEKGKDSQTIDNYTSMIIMLNNIAQLKIESQERRFSVPTVAIHDLRQVLSEQEIEAFAESLSGEEVVQEVAEFGEWLLQRKPTNSWMKAIKGEYYYHICSLTMPEWKNFIIKYVAEKGQSGVPLLVSNISAAFSVAYDLEENKRASLRFPDRSQKIEQFLKDYKHRGEFYIGTLTKEFKGNRELTAIVPSDEYLAFVEKEKAAIVGETEQKPKISGAQAMKEMQEKKERERLEREALDAL